MDYPDKLLKRNLQVKRRSLKEKFSKHPNGFNAY